jgi:DNA ligase D-like protein (predicted 3'-phosphoesterase)
MGQRGSLDSYRSKRDFRRTEEPPGGRRKPSKQPRFVIQKHDASRLHYDFRLEIDGVLVSWAVPKGPSTAPKDKRLAMRTENHPLEYADFEGVIPEGEYGAGTVQIWDAGTYRNLKEKDGKEVAMAKGLTEGHIAFWLEGKKLKGGYALTRMGKSQRWLLVKMKDEEKARSASG